jgi:hypothetical protein
LRFCTAIYNLLIDDEETAMMGKKLLAVATALALSGTAALAQQRFEGRVGPTMMGQHPGPSAEDLGAFTDARVAALKAGLRLTPDQEKNWPAFEQAYRNLAKLRTDRMAARGQGPAADDQSTVDRLQRRADAITQFGTALQDLAKAERPLYESLDEAQKRRFVAISRFMAPHRHFAMGGRGMGEHGMGGRDGGFGRGDHGPHEPHE